MQEGRGAQVTESNPSKLVLFGLAFTVIVADQLSKSWAVSTLGEGRRIPIIESKFDLRLVLNPGSAFGLFQGSTLAVAVASGIVTLGVIIWAVRDSAAPTTLGLVIGGGVGNLIDRVLRPPGGGSGHVVDFIYLSFWPTFNLADAAICVGVGLMLLGAFREERS